MLKKTMTYTDYNGEEITEDFYFNLNKAELIELELSATGGLEATIKRLMQEKNGKEIIAIFKELILKSYGIKTIDGKFKKSPEISKDFSETAAYPELFMELASDADAAAAFVNGLVS